MRIFLLILLFPFFSHSQVLHIDSTRFITGIHCCARFEYSIPTADKGLLLIGVASLTPGGIIPSFPLDTISSNVLIVKIDSSQQISWLKVYGGSGEDFVASACQTTDGGYAVLATTSSANGNIAGFKGANDIWLLRIDALGNLLWQKTYGSANSDQAISIAKTPDNGFILFGNTNGTDGDVPFHYGGHFRLDWLVIKTDGMGNVQWSKDIGGTEDEQINGTILSVDTSYYLIGSSVSHDLDCFDTSWHAPGVNTSEDYCIFKLDASGNIQWHKSYGGTALDRATYALFDDRDNSIVICGSTESVDYFVTGNHGYGDIWVVKVNKDGTLIWQKAFGSPSGETGSGVCAFRDGGYLVYGSTGSGTIGQANALLVATDSSGNEISNKIFGGNDREYARSIVPYLHGYAAVGFSGSPIFTEGTTYGNFSGGGGGYISYVDYWPLFIGNIQDSDFLKINVYPNPAKNTLRIALSQANVHGIVNIYNTKGQICFTRALGSNTDHIEISIKDWPKGTYIVQLQCTDGKVLAEKAVLN